MCVTKYCFVSRSNKLTTPCLGSADNHPMKQLPRVTVILQKIEQNIITSVKIYLAHKLQYILYTQY